MGSATTKNVSKMTETDQNVSNIIITGCLKF